MTGFLGFFRTEKVGKNVVADKPVPTAARGDAAQSSMRIELVRVVLQATLKKTGIPASWLGCEVAPPTRDSSSETCHTILVIKKWNEDLVRHVCAFEKELRSQLTRFDPMAKQSQYSFSWKIAADSGCPYQGLPEPDFWAQAGLPENARASIPVDRPAVKFDISDADYNHKSSGFAPTEPGGLN